MLLGGKQEIKSPGINTLAPQIIEPDSLNDCKIIWDEGKYIENLNLVRLLKSVCLGN